MSLWPGTWNHSASHGCHKGHARTDAKHPSTFGQSRGSKPAVDPEGWRSHPCATGGPPRAFAHGPPGSPRLGLSCLDSIFAPALSLGTGHDLHRRPRALGTVALRSPHEQSSGSSGSPIRFSAMQPASRIGALSLDLRPQHPSPTPAPRRQPTISSFGRPDNVSSHRRR